MTATLTGPLLTLEGSNNSTTSVDLSGLISNTWNLLGNGGTAYLTNFLGSVDAVSVTIKVSDTVAMRYAPGADGVTPNVLGGYVGNVISDTVSGGVIGGGGAGWANRDFGQSKNEQ